MKILDLLIFELERHAAPQKNSHNISNSNLKKIDFAEIRLKNFVGFQRTRANFWTVGQDMLKMTLLPLSQHNFGKSQEF